MLTISENIAIDLNEIEITAVRSQGAGGQNVNKVATAIHLRFDIQASSLPEACKQRLLKVGDRRITKDGVVIIKAQEFRSQEKNRDAALKRLAVLIQKAARPASRRRQTRPSAAARARRLDVKTQRGRIKSLRSKVLPDD